MFCFAERGKILNNYFEPNAKRESEIQYLMIFNDIFIFVSAHFTLIAKSNDREPWNKCFEVSCAVTSTQKRKYCLDAGGVCVWVVVVARSPSSPHRRVKREARE